MMTTAEEVESFIKTHDLKMECWYGGGQWHCRLRAFANIRWWSAHLHDEGYGGGGQPDGWDIQHSGNSLLEAQLSTANAYHKAAVAH